MLTVFYIALAVAAAACFFGATSHQRAVALSERHRTIVRGCGSLALIAAVAAAERTLGIWAAVFAVLTAFMLACVALPFLAASLAKQDESHVG